MILVPHANRDGLMAKRGETLNPRILTIVAVASYLTCK